MSIAKQVHHIQQIIDKTTHYYQKKTNSVRLVAVSKKQDIDAIQEAFAAGITDFGENYWQEAQPKIAKLQTLPIVWHFIGRVQSNKAANIAKTVSWVHSVDREKTARLLAKHRPAYLPSLNVCLQVNLDSEPNKSGITIDGSNNEELINLAIVINQLPGLKLRGLMAIPYLRTQPEVQYNSLLRLTTLLKQINQKLNSNLDTLSMGMSDDLVAAIRAGSTLVRIGRAIFSKQ